jgi:hypothetical protein
MLIASIPLLANDQDPELESLSDWVRTIRSLVQGRIYKLKNCVNSRPKSLSNEVGLYVVLLEVLLFMPNSLIRHSK